MDGRDLVRSAALAASAGAARRMRTVGAVWRGMRSGAERSLPRTERARVPGAAQGAEPGKGGGVVVFARSRLRIMVAVNGAAFWGWDDAGPEPSYGLGGVCPEADPRAVLEPDKDGGWRVVAERVTVAVTRFGAVEVRTPGGVTLRRALPPRWWEPADEEPAGEKPACGPARDGQPGEEEPTGGWLTDPELTNGQAGNGKLTNGQARDRQLANGQAGNGQLTNGQPTVGELTGPGPATGRQAGPLPSGTTLPGGALSAGALSGPRRPHVDGHARPEARRRARWLERSEVAADARFFGLGARSAGPRLPDGTYRLGNSAHARPVHPGTDPLGLTMPVQFVVADAAAHLVFHDNSWGGTVTWSEGAEGAGSGHDRAGICELRMEGGPLRCWVIVGSPARVLRTWATLTGPATLPPAWVLGHQHALTGPAGERELRALVAGHREHQLPLSAVHLDTVPREEADRGSVRGTDEGTDGRTDEGAHRDGIRLVTAAGPDGSAAPAGARRPERLRTSRRDPVPRGDDRPEEHNVRGLLKARAAYEALGDALDEAPGGERPFVLSRSGWVGLQRYGGAWAGDVATGWPGLRVTLSAVVGLGLCGVPYAGTDVGGTTGRPSAELYLRWLQLGAHLPLFRTLGTGRPGHEGPWEFGATVTGLVRSVLAERLRLTPYFVTLAHLARRTGAPIARPLWWAAPEDRALRDCQDAFLLGDCLLVAPVLEPGAHRRTVRLPRGRWYDTATEEAYEGPGQVTVEAPLSRIPVLARAGAVVPVRGEDGGTVLEVWEAASGHGGGGLVAAESVSWAGSPAGNAAGVAAQDVRIERYVTRRLDGRTVVQRQPDDGGAKPTLPMRIRGARCP